MRSRTPLLVLLVIGIGLAAAPVAFQMFSRAPLGGQMIAEFAPFMRAEKLDAFEGHLTRVGSALEALRRRGEGLDHPMVAPLAQEWPAIDADMTSMLDDIRDNIDNYNAVAALPPFPLFPWFFVTPGLMLAGLAGAALRRRDAGLAVEPRVRYATIVLGLGLVAAPFIFSMFTRAPLGGDMISDFKPLMTEQRIRTVQGYFLTIGAAEGALRTEVVPALDPDGPRVPEVHEFIGKWPAMAAEMAPMIGAMSDNRDNFAAVAAMPPFGLFPWFFVIPGLLTAGLAIAVSEPAASRKPEPDFQKLIQE